MVNKGNMTLRIEPELKEQAAALFKSLGMDLSTATGIFYRQALRYHGLPFEVESLQFQIAENPRFSGCRGAIKALLTKEFS